MYVHVRVHVHTYVGTRTCTLVVNSYTEVAVCRQLHGQLHRTCCALHTDPPSYV